MTLSYIYKKLKDPNILTQLDARFGLGRLEKLIFSNWFNPFLTLWINFRSLPIKYAIRLPIWIYGHPRLYCLSGKFQFKCKIKSGLIKINIVKYGAPGNMSSQSELYNLGTIIFEGRCEIGTGNKIITAIGKSLTLGNNCVIMDRCTIAVHDKIKIGRNTRIAHNCQIIDTNFHFIANYNKGIIPRRTAMVSIGESCWICNSSSIMMGSVIPNYAIVGSHSIVNKDFSGIEEGCIIAGAPAKLIKEKYIRVFNYEVEKKIWRYFNETDADYFPIKEVSIEELSKIDKL